MYWKLSFKTSFEDDNGAEPTTGWVQFGKYLHTFPNSKLGMGMLAGTDENADKNKINMTLTVLRYALNIQNFIADYY